MSSAWYALRVKGRFEKFVDSQLKRKGYETLLPTYLSTRPRSDRLKSLPLPHFHNYIFCRFDIDQKQPVLLTPGVQFVVGAGRIPLPVGRTDVASLRQLLKSGLNACPSPYLAKGQRVHVTSGLLKGLTGIVVRRNGRYRLTISIGVLMRSVSVELDLLSVTHLGPASFVPDKSVQA
jgi:transcription antitermination factor NusG